MATTKQNDMRPTDDQLLTAEDILSGGDDYLSPLEIPELSKNGKPGVVYLKPLSAGDVLDFAEGDKGTRTSRIIPLIAKAIVRQDGSPMFNDGEVARLRDIRMDVFTRLSKAVMATFNSVMDDDEGKALGEATGDLPIV